MYLSRLVCAFWFLFCSVHYAWAESTVHVILSSSDTLYQQVLDGFRSGLGTDALRHVRILNLQEVTADKLRDLARDDALLVPVGTQALQFVVRHAPGKTQIQALMVPKSVADALRSSMRNEPQGMISVIYVDQPPERIIALLKAMFPRRQQVGLVISAENASLLHDLQREAEKRDMQLSGRLSEDAGDVIGMIRSVVAQSEIMLLVPDAHVLNRQNLQSLMLSGYRLRVPVVGLSPGLVKSGAIAGLYSTPAQIGQQGAQHTLRWLNHGTLPVSSYPKRFSITTNDAVARSLGIILPSEGDVVEAMRREESGR